MNKFTKGEIILGINMIKDIFKILEEQYKVMRYGKLHRKIIENGIYMPLYIGFGFEMYYPDTYDTEFVLHVFDNDNLVIIHVVDLKNKEVLNKVIQIAKSLGYNVKFTNELNEKDFEKYFP